MKIKLLKKIKQAGAALLVALVLGGILCVSITGYLTVAEQQNYLSMRSQTWNIVMSVVEAGIEEGLQHLNTDPTAPGADGWTVDATGMWYSHNTTLTSGDSYVVMACLSNALQPVVVCRATVQSPTLFTKAGSRFMFAAAGVSGGSAASTTVTRAVQVKTDRKPLFTKAMVAKRNINLKGNNVSTDSFDSSDPFRSNYGKYDPNLAGSNGDVASNDTIVDTVTLGQANIYGHLQTGPNGTASVGGGGVGSYSWQASHNGFEPNGTEGQVWYSHDSNFTFPDVGLPYSSGLPPGGPADVVTTTYNITSNYIPSSSTYPNPPPWNGVSTNTLMVTQGTYPNPAPVSVTTNVTVQSSGLFPPAGTYSGSVQTNITPQTTLAFPIAGTYIGSVSTNIVVSGPPSGRGTWYSYNYVTGYSYYAVSYTFPTYTYNYANFGTNAIYSTNHYDHVLSSGDYYVDSSLSGATIVLGTLVNLVIGNGLNMNGNDSITIGNNASLRLYSGGTSATIGGNGVINKSGYAYDFIMYCAPSVTSFAFNGNGEFTGVLVAPNADMTMNGGGTGLDDFKGSVIANSIGMNGHFKFHYDEALGHKLDHARLLITSWDEVDPKHTP